MTKDIIDLLVKMLEEQGKKIDSLERKVTEIVDFKNRLIAMGVVLSAIFAFLWDWFKSLFYRG